MVGVQEVVGSCGEKDEDCSLSDQVMGLAEPELASTETTVLLRWLYVWIGLISVQSMSPSSNQKIYILTLPITRFLINAYKNVKKDIKSDTKDPILTKIPHTGDKESLDRCG